MMNIQQTKTKSCSYCAGRHTGMKTIGMSDVTKEAFRRVLLDWMNESGSAGLQTTSFFVFLSSYNLLISLTRNNNITTSKVPLLPVVTFPVNLFGTYSRHFASTLTYLLLKAQFLQFFPTHFRELAGETLRSSTLSCQSRYRIQFRKPSYNAVILSLN
jgi:hypothetical protein